ncbi:MAG: exosortase [Nitrospirae bacterium]|nr:exosortase [Nitrospirota bacterium]
MITFFGPLRELALTSWRNEYYTYIPFIPFISAYLIHDDRQNIFSRQEYSLIPGLALIGISGLLLYVVHAHASCAGSDDRLSITTFLLIMLWTGGFTLFYGIGTLKAAAFPLLFLLFAVPIPNIALEKAISLLQIGSAEVAYWLLHATGMPLARDGFVFHLSKMDIEVAPQCSGIRSSLSLVITGVLAAYFFLRTGWARALLMLSLVPIAILKNGIRIATLAILAIYWDEKILSSDLHHKGGIVFFIFALLIAGAVIVLLRKMESRKK